MYSGSAKHLYATSPSDCLLVWISVCVSHCLEFLAKLLVEVRGLLQSGL